MSSGPLPADWEPAACRRTDAVLALYLDGDFDDGAHDCRRDGFDAESGYTFACGDSLSSHLRECAACQRALRRARRLDAFLANDAGRTAADHRHEHAAGGSAPAMEQRWFAAVAAATADGHTVTRVNRPLPERAPERLAGNRLAGNRLAGNRLAGNRLAGNRRLPFAWLAAGTMIAASVGWRLVDRTSHDVETTMHAAIPFSTTHAATGDGTPNESGPEQGGGRLTKARLANDRRDANPTFTPASIQRLRHERQAAVLGQAVSVADLQQQIHGRAAPGDRLQAARGLIVAARSSTSLAAVAGNAIIEAVANCSDRTPAEQLVHGELLDLVRAAPHLLVELQQRLARLDAPSRTPGRADLAAVLVAARVGDRMLDEGLRKAVVRHPYLAEPLAAALRGGQREHGGGTLLLRVWRDLAARGEAHDLGATAALWFQGQPASLFAEVARELREVRCEEHRQRCLMALGCASDSSTLAVLLPHLSSPQRAEAMVAAFALTSLPHAVLASLVPMAEAESAWLLRAALARAGLPAARPWLTGLLLRSRELYHFERATLAEFPEVASWFRDREAPLGD